MSARMWCCASIGSESSGRLGGEGRAHNIMKRLCLVALWVAALGLVLAPVGWAQKGDPDTRSLHGQVLDKNGTPIEKAVVYLKNTRNLQMRTYIADEGGAFHFQGLNANTDYEVHAEHEGAASPKKTISSFDSRKEIHILLKLEKK